MVRFFLFTFVFFLAVANARAQGLSGEVDALGRPIRPTIGTLPSVFPDNMTADAKKHLDAGFFSGLKGNAYTPYNVVPKNNLSVVAELSKYLNAKELKAGRYWETVGVQYLATFEVLEFKTEDFPEQIVEQANNKRPVKIPAYTICTANMTVKLTDVATTKILVVQNFRMTGNSSKYKKFRPEETNYQTAERHLSFQLKDYGAEVFKDIVAGTARIQETSKNSKGYADEVIVDGSPLLKNSTIGTYFEVFSIEEIIENEGQEYAHIDQMGKIRKEKTYDYKKGNFNVKKGSEEIQKAFEAGKVLFCANNYPPLRPLAPSAFRPTLRMDTFVVKTELPPFARKTIEDGIAEYLSKYPQMLDLVDREIYDAIEQERKVQNAMKSDATAASASFGADFMLQVDIIEYSFERKEKMAERKIPNTDMPDTSTEKEQAKKADKKTTSKKEAKKKIEKPKLKLVDYEMVGWDTKSNLKLEFRLVKIENGQILLQKSFQSTASKVFPVDLEDTMLEKQKYEMLREVVRKASEEAGTVILPQVGGTPKVLKIYEEGKKGAEKLLLGGGKHGGNFFGRFYTVYGVSMEEVDGEQFERTEPIGKIKIIETYPETSVAKVKKGGAEIAEALKKGQKLICRFE